MKNIQEIIIWLFQNQDYYDEIKFIRDLVCEDCKSKGYPIRTGPNCKHRIYSAEYEFYDYFNSLVNLLEAREVCSKIEPLLQKYDNLPLNDINALDFWCNELLEFEEKHLLNFRISDLESLDKNGVLIGVKPANTKIYKKKQFIIPKKGFENLFRINKLLEEHFTIESTSFPTIEILNLK